MKKELGDPGKAGMTLNEEERKEGRKVRWKCLRLQSSPKGSLAELLGVLMNGCSVFLVPVLGHGIEVPMRKIWSVFQSWAS